MAIKRMLLESAVRDDAEPERFEEWLLKQCLAAPPTEAPGAYRAMALDIAADWRLAHASPYFRNWLERGTPSDDARSEDDASSP